MITPRDFFLDADKYCVLPSRITYSTYFSICARNNAMDMAVTRYSDALTCLHIQPDSTMVRGLLDGMNRCGMVEEATALMARVKEVPMDVYLLNTMLETLLLSSDAEATYSLYDACVNGMPKHKAVLPTTHTFCALLLAFEKNRSLASCDRRACATCSATVCVATRRPSTCC